MAPSQKAVDCWNLCSLLCPAAALGVNAVVQVTMVRVRKGYQFFRCNIDGFFAGALAVVLIETLLLRSSAAPPDAPVISWLVNLPAYAALSYCYFAGFTNLGQTSIRIRLYAEIAETPDGMPVERIKEIYDEKALGDLRLRRLLDTGDVVERGGRFFTGRRRLATAAQILTLVRRLILGRASEFADAE
jgi:hypothetical protein